NLQGKLEEANTELATLRAGKHDRNDAELKQIKAERDDLARRLDAALKEIANRTTETRTVEVRPQAESETVKNLEKERDDLKQQLDTMRRELAALQALHDEDARGRDSQARKVAELQAERED